MVDSVDSKVVVGSDDLSGGLVTVRPSHQITETQCSSMKNLDPFQSFGALVSRNGSRYYIQTGLTAGNTSTGIFEYIKADGTTILYMVYNNLIFQVAAPSTKSIVYAKNPKTVTQIQEFIADHVTFTSTAHGYSTGDLVIPYGATSVTTYNNNTYDVLVEDADHFRLRISGNSVQPVANNTFSSNTGFVTKTSGSPTPIGDCNFTTFNDFCIAVSPAISTVKSSGGAFSNLVGTPPANAKYIQSHKNRVFIAHHTIGGSPEYRSRLSFCVLGDAEDWTTITGASTDAGFIDVGKDDGDVITGIVSLGSVLVVFKNNSTWMLQGSGPENFTVRPISQVVGCIASKSIVKCDQFALFLSELGVYTVTANGNGVVLNSYNIQPTIDAYTRTERVAAVAGRLKKQFWITFLSGVTYTTYVLDYVYGSWTRYTNLQQTQYLTRRDGTFFWRGGGTFSDVDIIQGDIGAYDELKDAFAGVATAVPIVWEFYTKDFDFGDWVARKQPYDFFVQAAANSGVNINATIFINGVSGSSITPISLTPPGLQTRVIVSGGSHWPTEGTRNYLKYYINGTSSTVHFTIYGYSAMAEVLPRK